MSNAMIHLIYMSSAAKEMNEEDLLEMLAQSRSRNEAQNITGMLLYKDGVFLQALEGNAKDVDDIYKSILLDKRNTGHYLIEEKEIIDRQFPDWSMGFEDLTNYRPDELEGYSEIFNKEKQPKEFAKYKHMAMALLLKF